MTIAQSETRTGLVRSRFSPVGGARKRLFDMTAAAILLFIFAPLLVLIALTICVTDRGTVFYGHGRLGYDGRRFKCLKFRSMVHDSDAALERHLSANPAARAEWDASQKLRDDPRVTPIGRLLRDTSLDELPQLINVLLGDMSLVGPRPIVQAEVDRYRHRIDDYLRTRPGITGLWQVSGRSDVDYDRRVLLDSQYVASWSFTADVIILLRTVKVVFSREGSC
jgi:Undecaprenyl-phosphate galactose phosphotransferase WbaP